MEKKSKVIIAASLLAVVAAGGIAVGTTTALFTRQASSHIHIQAGTLDVGFYVNKITVDRLNGQGGVDKDVEIPLKETYGSTYYVDNKGIDLVKFEGNQFSVENAFPSMEAKVTYLIENNSEIAIKVTSVDTPSGKFADNTDIEDFSVFHIVNDMVQGSVIKPGESLTYNLSLKFDEDCGEEYESCTLDINSVLTATQVTRDDTI